jgi:hypothetical protein
MENARDVLSMDLFGRLGRTGNQVIQYMFLRTYAETHGLELLLPPWEAAPLFGANHRARPASLMLPRIYERRDAEDRVHPPTRVHRNVDMTGYFHFRTSYYKPWATRIRALFSPGAELRPALGEAARRLRPGRGILVGVHIRLSDYGFKYFYRTPVQWYLDWLEQNWSRLPSPSLYVASDVPGVREAFERYRPLDPPEFPGLPSWAPDFLALAHCDVMLMPNSTFSFAAAMIGNPRMKVLRADPGMRGFRPIDIWDSEPLRKDIRYENASEQTELWRPDAGRLKTPSNSHYGQYLIHSRKSDW